ncbi:MAG: hypothetical protein M1818_004316 [Claussenomyces sp. TS43310]|nr:MAG: hypothetical protein M1818_004316 [Claussenomyces sp. TS43310]
MSAATFQSSSKRGLIFIPNPDTPQDNTIWEQGDLTWYYNYGLEPSPSFSPNTSFHFVPMLWGAPNSTTDTAFLDGVKAQLSAGSNVSYVLTFNEPDGTSTTGGSNVSPDLAAQTWIREVEPLRALGVKTGAPAVTGSTSGFTWLQSFFSACNGGCTADFIPVHWYGDFQGLADHIGQVRGTYPNTTIWITEYALPNDKNLTDTQSFFNTSAEYFDRLDYVTHYSYFGSFRSSASNVGANPAMLSAKGELTDIGSWYLGGAATGTMPTSDGAVVTVGSMWALFVVGICFYML